MLWTPTWATENTWSWAVESRVPCARLPFSGTCLCWMPTQLHLNQTCLGEASMWERTTTQCSWAEWQDALIGASESGSKQCANPRGLQELFILVLTGLWVAGGSSVHVCSTEIQMCVCSVSTEGFHTGRCFVDLAPSDFEQGETWWPHTPREQLHPKELFSYASFLEMTLSSIHCGARCLPFTWPGKQLLFSLHLHQDQLQTPYLQWTEIQGLVYSPRDRCLAT